MSRKGTKNGRIWRLLAKDRQEGKTRAGSARVPPGRILCLGLLAWGVAGACRLDMHDQPRYESLEASTFFPDGRASRELPEGTVPRGFLAEDELFYRGTIDGELSSVFPFPVSRQLLERGQERYNAFCSPCHGRVGDGRGIIVERGMKPPPSFHIVRLQEAPPGYFFDVITNGFGAMYSYASRVPPRDRWAIVAYIRALQLSQQATVSDVSSEELQRIEELEP